MITIKHGKFNRTVPKLPSKLLEISIIMTKKFRQRRRDILFTTFPILHIYLLSFIPPSKYCVGVSETLSEIPSSKLCVFQEVLTVRKTGGNLHFQF